MATDGDDHRRRGGYLTLATGGDFWSSLVVASVIGDLWPWSSMVVPSVKGDQTVDTGDPTVGTKDRSVATRHKSRTTDDRTVGTGDLTIDTGGHHESRAIQP